MLVTQSYDKPYLWKVMEKTKLVWDREKRALATPLELGSQESVTPVSRATKSGEGGEAETGLLDTQGP